MNARILGPGVHPGPLPTPDAAPPAVGPRLLVRVVWYTAAAVLALLLAGVGYRLDAHDLRVPILYYDARGLDTDPLLILPMVKSTLERGSHWRCERLGAPGGQEMHDFPVVDHFHFALIWLLGRFVPNAVVVFNLYYLLTFPLTALTAMAVLRHFDQSFPAAAVGAVLYAFTPYHLLRGENHFFLSAYYVVPVTVLVMLWVCRGRLPFFPGGRFGVRDRDTIFAAVVAVVTASAGAYYAFFACGLFVMAGVYGWVANRTWKAAASAGLILAITFAAGVVNHLPTFFYQARFGKHTAPTERFSEEADSYGLKLAQLVLPIEDHSVIALAAVKATYNSPDRPAQVWTERYSLGLVGAAGLLLLLFRVVFPVERRWPYAPLAALTAAAVLIGSVGGVGSAFNHLVSPQVRCYNRIAIYIAFFCLFAILRAADAWAARLLGPNPRRGRRAAVLAGWAGLCWVGVWDATPFYWAGEKTAERQREQCDLFAADAAFFGAVEEVLNPEGAVPGPAVFQLPYVKWPEAPPVRQVFSYEHARGYVHTRTLRWSFGCMKGREVDEWYRRVSALAGVDFNAHAVEQMLERVVKAGFEGLFLDKRGYTPARAEALHRELSQRLGGVRQIAHRDGRQIFFDLRPYRDAVRQGRDWEAECWRELHPVTILWLHGFVSFREPGLEWQHRWCGPDGLAVFVNPTDETKTYTVKFNARTEYAEPSELVVDGGSVWSERLTIDKTSPLLERTFAVPPGRHPVRFRCTPPPHILPTDTRKLTFFLAGLKLE